MGVGLRVFLLDENKIEKISFAKFNRFRNGYDSLPEYSGKRIRTAVVVVETENYKPVSIIDISCSYINVNQNGKLDQKEKQNRMIDALRLIQLPPVDDLPPNVINSSSDFAKKRFKNKYLWTPTENELRTFAQLIFKKSNRK